MGLDYFEEGRQYIHTTVINGVKMLPEKINVVKNLVVDNALESIFNRIFTRQLKLLIAVLS